MKTTMAYLIEEAVADLEESANTGWLKELGALVKVLERMSSRKWKLRSGEPEHYLGMMKTLVGEIKKGEGDTYDLEDAYHQFRVSLKNADKKTNDRVLARFKKAYTQLRSADKDD